MSSLISHSQLVAAKRLLYMTHLAIGDFIYQGVWLNALKAKYPHLVIDIWFDDCRRRPHSWAAGRNKLLCELLEAEGSFDVVHPIVSDITARQTQIDLAKNRDYDLIVFIGKNRSEQFAKVARQISSSAFIVAAKSKPLNNFLAKWWYFSKLDGNFSYERFAARNAHVTQLYRECFRKVFGLTMEDTQGRQFLEVQFDPRYQSQARELIGSYGRGDSKKLVVFVNHLSTSSKKDYPWDQLRKVLLTLNDRYENLAFIISTAPDKFEQISSFIKKDRLLGALEIGSFTATESFFQLPALMAECDIVISVDTATTHLAASLGKPQVAIMANGQKLWQPLGDSLILEGNGKASSVTAAQVVEAFDQLYIEHVSKNR